MALGVSKQELLADWEDEDFSTSPPDVEGLVVATEEDVARLQTVDPTGLVQGAVESAQTASPSKYRNEANKLYVGREIPIDEFSDWWGVQYLGSRPFNGVMVHHTYKPNQHYSTSLQTVHNIFNYYRTTLGWPAGKGPHLWLDPHRKVVYVGTHPASNGIGASYRNDRWLHIEAIWNGDEAMFSGHTLDLYAEVLRVVCGERGIPLQHTTWNGGKGVNSPNSPHDGYMFHRKVASKSCPGSRVGDAAFEREIRARAGGSKPGNPGTGNPGTGNPGTGNPGTEPEEPSFTGWINVVAHRNDSVSTQRAKQVVAALKASGVPRVGFSRRINKALIDARTKAGVYSLFVGSKALTILETRRERLEARLGGKTFTANHNGAVRGAEGGVYDGNNYSLRDVLRWRIADLAQIGGGSKSKVLTEFDNLVNTGGDGSGGSYGEFKPGADTGKDHMRDVYGIVGSERYSREKMHTWVDFKKADPRGHELVDAAYNQAPELWNAIGAPCPPADILVVQSYHETGAWRWPGDSEPWTTSGVKKAGKQPDAPGAFEESDTPEDGVRVQANHVAWYLGNKKTLGEPHPRWYDLKKYRPNERARTTADLASSYAGDAEYAIKLNKLLDELEGEGGGGEVPKEPEEARPEDFARIRGWNFGRKAWETFTMEPRIRRLCAFLVNECGVKKSQISTYRGHNGKHGRNHPGSAIDIMFSNDWDVAPTAAQKKHGDQVWEKVKWEFDPNGEVIDYGVWGGFWNNFQGLGDQRYDPAWAPYGSWLRRMHRDHHHWSCIV